MSTTRELHPEISTSIRFPEWQFCFQKTRCQGLDDAIRDIHKVGQWVDWVHVSCAERHIYKDGMYDYVILYV